MSWKNKIGMKFGDLTVIAQDYAYQVPSTGRLVPRWKCKCNCGSIVVVPQANLSNGSATCCYACTRQNTIDDLTGLKFGRLTVIKRAPDYECESGKEAQWLCKCDCGIEVIVRGRYLRNGRTTSCGCSRMENKNLTNDERHIKYLNRQVMLVPYGTYIQPNSVVGVSFLTNKELVEYKNNLDTKEN